MANGINANFILLFFFFLTSFSYRDVGFFYGKHFGIWTQEPPVTWIQPSVGASSEGKENKQKNTQSAYASRVIQHKTWQLYIRINLPLFFTVFPSNSMLFLSCRPFVVITTFSRDLVGVEVTSVS